MIGAGDEIPFFRMLDQDAQQFDGSALRGRWVLLYWYPRADTPGCTAQAQSLRDQFEVFEALGCDVFGISLDPPAVNREFRHRLGLPFRLLSDDAAGTVSEAFGVVVAEGGTPARDAFLIDPSGTLVRRYSVEEPGFFAEMVLDDLESAIER